MVEFLTPNYSMKIEEVELAVDSDESNQWILFASYNTYLKRIEEDLFKRVPILK